MKPYAAAFYHSRQWQELRDVILKRDAYLCRDCLIQGRIQPAEEVHHVQEITPQNIHDPAVTLNADNLISLCRECHRKRHGTAVQCKRYEVDAAGRVTIPPDPK